MLAIMIQCHRRLDRVRRLVDWLRGPGREFFIVVDRSAESDLQDEYLSGLPGDTHILEAPPTIWGGVSILYSTLSTIRCALNASQSWRHFINISGDDIPLRPVDEMIEVLNAERAKGYTSFIADFGAPPINWPAALDGSVTAEDDLTLRPDVILSVAGQARDLFASSTTNPRRQPQFRPSVFVCEEYSGKRLIVRPPHEDEIRARELFFSKYPFRFGRQWIIASRSLCEFCVGNPISSQILSGLSTCFIPDESFFQMVAKAAQRQTGGIKPTNLRFDFGAPVDISDDRLGDLELSSAFFARKLNFSKCEAIDAWIDEMVGAS